MDSKALFNYGYWNMFNYWPYETIRIFIFSFGQAKTNIVIRAPLESFLLQKNTLYTMYAVLLFFFLSPSLSLNGLSERSLPPLHPSCLINLPFG